MSSSAAAGSSAQMWQCSSMTPEACRHSNKAECRVVAATLSISPTNSLVGSVPAAAEAAVRSPENSLPSSAASAGSAAQASATSSCTRSCRAPMRLRSYALHCEYSDSLKRSGAVRVRTTSSASISSRAWPRGTAAGSGSESADVCVSAGASACVDDWLLPASTSLT
eukprot:2963540-Prymnesium_polylepis.1